MKSIYEKKSVNLKALDVDTSKRKVKIAIAQMEDVDRDGDVFAKTAFDRTIKLKGPQGSNEVWHLLDHYSVSSSALSKFMELFVEGKYLVGISQYKDSFAWREIAWPLYESGDFTQHSVGFRTIRSEQRDGEPRIITEAELWEGSAVLWGAQKDTPTQEVWKSMSHEERKADIHSRMERLNTYIHSRKSEIDFEEAKSLIQIEFKQIQQQLLDLQQATQPAAKASDPDLKSKEGVAETKTRRVRSFSELTNLLID